MFSNVNNTTGKDVHWRRKICKCNYFYLIQWTYFNKGRHCSAIKATKMILLLQGKAAWSPSAPFKGLCK